MDSPQLVTKPKNIKLNISCDRQVRSCIIAWSKNIPYTKMVEPIVAKLPIVTISNLYTLLTKGFNLDSSSFYMTYNGQSWARSKYMHIKAFVKPIEFISKKLYPKWSILSTEVLANNLKTRWDDTLFKYLKVLVDSMTISESKGPEVYIPDGYLHGIYNSRLVNPKDLYASLLKLEQHLFTSSFKGAYSILILPYEMDGKCNFLLASRVDERDFKLKFPDIEVVIDKYSEPKRYYYTRSKNVDDRSFILPTEGSIIYRKRSRKRRNQ